MASLSSPLRASSRSLTALSMAVFSPASSLSPCSPRLFLTLCTAASPWLRAWTSSSFFLSSAAFSSASFTIFWISSSDRPEFALMVILFSLPDALSLADTFRMPLASMSKATSICGTPRAAGGMPSRLNSPSILLPEAISRSPWNTLMVTAGWLSSAVEKVCANFVGMVVFFVIILVITPPSVSMPSDSGVTSSSSTSLRSPDRTWPCTAAPTATASSGFTSLRGSLPKNSLTFSCTLGMRVMPPTRMTSSMSDTDTPASLMAVRQGAMVRSIRSSTRLSSLERVSLMFRCLGPEASAVM